MMVTIFFGFLLFAIWTCSQSQGTLAPDMQVSRPPETTNPPRPSKAAGTPDGFG